MLFHFHPTTRAAVNHLITGSGIRGVTTKILKMIAPIIVPHRGRIYSTSAYHKGVFPLNFNETIIVKPRGERFPQFRRRPALWMPGCVCFLSAVAWPEKLPLAIRHVGRLFRSVLSLIRLLVSAARRSAISAFSFGDPARASASSRSNCSTCWVPSSSCFSSCSTRLGALFQLLHPLGGAGQHLLQVIVQRALVPQHLFARCSRCCPLLTVN